jgi:hypothetical protein
MVHKEDGGPEEQVFYLAKVSPFLLRLIFIISDISWVFDALRLVAQKLKFMCGCVKWRKSAISSIFPVAVVPLV